jgi:CubicO group peptidase (beta-lactamase class C family)
MKRTRHTPILLALLLALCAVASAQTESMRSFEPSGWPDTRAGGIARRFVEAFHAEDEEVMRRFTLEYRDEESLQRMPLEARMAQFRQMREQIGALEVVALREAGEHDLEVFARSQKLGMWLSMRFQVQESPPHKLAHFTMKPSPPPELAQKEFDDWDTLLELAEQVLEDSGMPAIALAVVEGTEVAERAVAGVRSIDAADPVGAEDLFHIGSVTKSFTGTLIAALVESGTLRWDLAIGTALAGIDMRPEYREATLEQLLQHRAGVRPYTDDRVDEFPDALDGPPTEQRELFVKQVLSQEPVGATGEYLYSNAGYAVAAYVAERATGRSYEELVRTTILEPLEMRAALFDWPASSERPDQPRGHYGSPPELRVQGLEEYTWHAYMNPPGGLSCSVEELSRYAALHLRGLRGEDGILRAETIRRLHTPMSGAGPGDGYASGWVIAETGVKHWHNGSAGTFFSAVALYPQDGIAVVALTNCAGSAGPMLETLVDQIHAAWVQRAAAR